MGSRQIEGEDFFETYTTVSTKLPRKRVSLWQQVRTCTCIHVMSRLLV
jgi:hypothetical protein